MKTIDGNEFDTEALKEQAVDYVKQGYNCVQAVICAVGPELGMDTDTASRATLGFGGGMGTGTEACGAISGGIVVLGYANNKDADSPKGNASTYGLAKELVERFDEKVGATMCNEIKGVNCDHPMLRSCIGCVEDATEITVEMLKEM